MNSVSRFHVVWACATLALIAGCGGSDVKPIANLAVCQGTVTLDGKPLERGMVAFSPEGTTGQVAVSQIDKDGKFSMRTTVSAPGVVVGKYKVRIESSQESKSTNPTDPAAKPVSLIPEKYTAIATSGLEVEVKPGMAPVKFELTSK